MIPKLFSEGVMKLIAKVFDYEIYSPELDREIEKLTKGVTSSPDPDTLNIAISRLINRYLLLHEAEQESFSVCDEEYEAALLDIIDIVESCDELEETLTVNGMPALQIERLIRNKIIVKKFIQSICAKDICITEDDIKAFYEEQREYFFREPEVRASHILVRGVNPESEAKIKQIRAQVKTAEDFIKRSNTCSDCPSNSKCGDLGFFSRGTLLKEIEDIAFSLKINEISEPFQTHYGYHILMVTDRHEKGFIPLHEIKDSLKARLIHIEKEYFLAKYLKHLRSTNEGFIQIY